MADYSKTLQLPKTAFPMRGNLPNKEPERQKRWKEEKIYQQVLQKRQGAPKFILHDGPPYANGDLHIGHALNKILKDFIVRYKSLAGFDAPYIPGWDTHGLPIEHAIVTKKKVDRRSVDIPTFRDLCTDYALSFVERQKSQFERLGVRGDWENPYITLKPEYEAEQIRLFGDMMAKGHIYRGMKAIYWSPSSETALAEAEIEYHDKRSASIYVAFPVVETAGVFPEGSEVVIWTTTPWTIPANLGIALNENFSYSLVETGDRKLVLATDLVPSVMKTIEVEDYKITDSWQGKELAGVVCRHPFYDRKSPLVFGDHVTLDAGTGFVHTAPGHGEDDFWLGKKYNLGVLSPIDGKGKYTDQAPGFEGIYYEDGNKKVTEKLEEVGALLKLTFITHSYPHDWRTKKPIIYRATEQWFASIDGFREEMLEQIKQVKWTPEWGEVRLSNMIADRGDWCISRQRVWGVPLPIFYCTSCNHPHINEETIEFIAELFAREGSNAWYKKDVAELMPEGHVCEQCGGKEFVKETDTMDVWFDSGSSHRAVLTQREETVWPADLYLEGSDQYRGWFNSSLSTAVATTGRAPYKGVLSHGFTLDGEGRKMSKSLGNVIDPAKVMKQYGADILRLWVASSDYQADFRVSDEILKQIAEVYRKLRNTFRFLLGNLADFDPRAQRVAVDQMDELEKYVLIKLQSLVDRVTKGYEKYDFNQVYTNIHQFCTVFLSQFYLDVRKDRLYVEAPNSVPRRATQTVLHELLVTLVKLLAPIIPHTADEVWEYVAGEKEASVELTDFPVVQEDRLDTALEKKWDQFLTLRDTVLKALEEARAAKTIGNSLVAKVEITPGFEAATLLNQIPELKDLFIVSDVEMNPVSGDVETIEVKVTAASGEKCERCWVISPSVGQNEHHPTLCDRCAPIVEENFQDLEV
ncbi:isoleucine--tRNA ligase [Shimazuella sp. AN120528]|uniref:isoleucine--tRNA ligase n=1 Tax=Shimazuella soli TaxID=1892854 RepID=UPI001F0F6289|nr:isoleucine--tRNA ligase [Shimazuella soli]MCH5584729.1 isoleucine--tRNA ligase [Shimazuella soli]